MSGDLTAWLREQIDEDERKARVAGPSPWKQDLGVVAWVDEDRRRHVVADCAPRQVATHIETWDPARVLAECEAKRRLVELHAAVDQIAINPAGHCQECSDSGWSGCVDGAQPVDYPCTTVRLLALPYRGRPGYREEWAPR